MNHLVPEKYFYTIGDVSKMTGVKPHILRYWEEQFKALRPGRRYSGHRKYTRREIELVQKIKHLVLERRFRLEGAKQEISRQMSSKPQPTPTGQSVVSALPALQEIKNDIEACLAILGPEAKQEQFDFK